MKNSSECCPEVVEKERSKKQDWELNLIKLKEILINLG